MEILVVGLCTLCGVGLAVGFTRASLELIINMIPARPDAAARVAEPAPEL